MRHLAMIVGLAGLTACGGGTDNLVDRARQVVDEQRRGAITEIERKLAELDQRMEEVRKTARSAEAARDGARRHLADLEREHRQLRERLHRAQRAGRKALEEIEQSVDRALQELEETFDLSSEDPASGA
jgi:chromosome segregation ATPase